jgi:hypothetical protein
VCGTRQLTPMDDWLPGLKTCNLEIIPTHMHLKFKIK